ncbi:WYL domain-containing protein [Thiorhodococcus mannitoliphagus]|uniref:WYL domain-containing protein n=1 Tax=Thiorhodococcus mannitoliphagus TaxID=329406 RepID=A0A6P1DX64_9GAMM|nr:WYL domain-containing protein [Thiorhodococcus mannitoliphagus]NEX22778.1 WYL domain-containing protein [Thiorhodococcus mannitoliphagus]
MKTILHGRFERQKRIEGLLPPAGAAELDCRDPQWLLQRLGEDYGDADASARLRALQRALKALVKEGRIEAVNPGKKPLRYRRRKEDLNEDSAIWAYTVRQIFDLVADVVPRRQLDRLWEQLRSDEDAPLLDAERLRIVPDTLRLQPPLVCLRSLTAVITALAKGQALAVHYENAEGERKEARIHPQALIQRGPIPYLFALKNDEDSPVRLYALQRMLSAKALATVPARKAPGFTIDKAIADGKVDFGQGEMIRLELQVRGYLTQILQVCRLSTDQQEDDEPDGSAFAMRVTATVPSTGQLLRWVLGAGPNLEVVAPSELRHTVAVQAAKMAGLYGTG